MSSIVKHDITIEYDETIESYFIVWEYAVIGLGKTKRSALKDLQKAAHFGIDTIINSKLKTLKIDSED